jgi:predicted ATPase
VLGFERNTSWGSGFPFDLPAMTSLDRLALGQPVTLLAGDNGSGKSTVLGSRGAATGTSACRAP